MKNQITAAFIMLCLSSHAQTTPYVGFNAGYLSNKKGVYGFEFGVESAGLIFGADVRLQSSSTPVLLGLKTGWFKPLDYCQHGDQAIQFTIGGYLAKRNNHTKYHVSELALTGNVRYYFKRFFFIETGYEYMEEKHYGGIGIGIMGWFDK